jgi:hypothetical protein
MPLTFWAAQTKAALSLLGAGVIGSTFTSYISPTSAASSIQHIYCHHLIWQNRCLLPCLCGPHTSRPGCLSFMDDHATKMNARYRSMLATMYQDWAAFPMTDLVSFLSALRGQDIDLWPPFFTDWVTFNWEYSARNVIMEERWAEVW